jgi:hypothetical protein
MGAADRGNLGVESLDGQAAALATRHDPVVPDRSTGIEWLDIFSERREYVGRHGQQALFTTAIWKALKPVPNLRDSGLDPPPDHRRRFRSHQLGQDVGVNDDHQ